MSEKRLTPACAFCQSTTFITLRKVSIELAAASAAEDRFAGEATVCSGCGHLAFFVDDPGALVGLPGAINVEADASPYR